jgi:hypothetical protein
MYVRNAGAKEFIILFGETHHQVGYVLPADFSEHPLTLT